MTSKNGYIYTKIYIPTAPSTMNLFAPYDVHHPMNAVSSELLFLSCNDVCDWSCELIDEKT